MEVREFNNLVDEWSDRLFRFALSVCKNADLAKDCVQEAYMRLWEKRHTVDSSRARSYLFTTVHHRLIDEFRRNAKVIDLPQNEVVFQPETGVQEALHRALDTLPDVQRSVVLLRDYEGYSYEEIAEITGLSLSQVKVYIFRARKKLKEVIVRVDVLL
ncbi:MAG: RNA polymerase sigma factor [Salibacteraceae bacterium]